MLTLNFNPFPILLSERLRFRRLTDNDVNEVFELRSNPETMKYIPRPLATNHDDAYSHIKMINANLDANTNINWAITEKEDDKCIGIIGFYRTQPENFRTEIGYIISPQYKNKGYATEAVNNLLDYAFKELNFNSIEAVIDPRNLPSEKVLLKNGFVKEGHFVENHFYNETFLDSAIYTLLNRNFKKLA